MEGMALGMKALVGGAVGKRLYVFIYLFSYLCLHIDKMSSRESVIPQSCFVRALCVRGFSRSSVSHHGCDG